ncbi:MAG: DedA family protein [Actinomycetes bacterium]
MSVAPITASLTEPLIQFAVNVVGDLGLAGIFGLMLLESACIPIPSEATMLFAGFAVDNGDYALWAAVLAGTAGNVVGSWIAWWIGRVGRIDLIEKHGGKIGIRKHHLDLADRWFERHGEATVFFARLLPIVRTFISLPAGVARMPFWRFTIYTALGCLPWVFALTWAGKQAGSNWTEIKGALEYVDYVVAAGIIATAIIIFFRVRRNRAAGEGNTPDPDALGS